MTAMVKSVKQKKERGVKHMIDMHCHIVPHIDDGAKNMEESIKMAQIAVKDGIRTIINTSHFNARWDIDKQQKLQKHLETLQQNIEQKGIDLQILPGNEAFLTPNLLKAVEQRKVYTLNNSRYLLIELPFHDIPTYTTDTIYELKLKGIVPIIAHPERYAKVIETPSVVYEWIKEGALIQITAGSLTGRFGQLVQKTTELLLKHNQVHFIGSDAHSPRNRRPELKKAMQAAAALIGVEQASKLVGEYVKAVISDKEFAPVEPIHIKRKKSFLLKKIKGLFCRDRSQTKVQKDQISG